MSGIPRSESRNRKRAAITGAVDRGFTPPNALVEAMSRYQTEQRDANYFTIAASEADVAARETDVTARQAELTHELAEVEEERRVLEAATARLTCEQMDLEEARTDFRYHAEELETKLALIGRAQLFRRRKKAGIKWADL